MQSPTGYDVDTLRETYDFLPQSTQVYSATSFRHLTEIDRLELRLRLGGREYKGLLTFQ